MESLRLNLENAGKTGNEYNKNQENLLQVYKRENEALKEMIHHYETTLKCREKMMLQYISEIQELKKAVQTHKKTIEALTLELKSFQNERYFKEKTPINAELKKLRPTKSAKSIKVEHLYVKSCKISLFCRFKLLKIEPGVNLVTKSQGIGINTSSFFQENDKFSALFTAGFQKKFAKQKYKKIEDLSKCHGDYYIAFNALSFFDREEIVETTVSCFQELMAYSKVNFRLRGVLNVYRNIGKSSSLEEIIFMLNKEIPFLFNCYKKLKAHVYLLDEYAQELWTPLDKPDCFLRLPLDVKDNAVVYSVLHDKLIRIDNPQNDAKFSRNLDKEKNFVMKSVLCFPMKTSDDKAFGVIELINKHEGGFANEDEDFLNLISSQITTLLMQYIEGEKNGLRFNKINTLIKLALELPKIDDFDRFLIKTEEKINELMGTELCSVVFVDQETKSFIKIHQNERKTVTDTTMGIVGSAFSKDCVVETKNPKHDTNFNHCIDLETELPTVTFPVKFRDKTVGIVQMIHLRKKIGEKFLKKSFFCEKEFLDLFSGLLGLSFQNRYIKKGEDFNLGPIKAGKYQLIFFAKKMKKIRKKSSLF